MPLKVRVEVEEDIYSFAPADNGAGPLWCHGSTVVARQGERVFVAGLETLADHKPLNNCCWVLFCRDAGGWQRVYRDAEGRTREPSPLVLLAGGDLLVSANPTLAGPEAYSGPAQPVVFRFKTAALDGLPRLEYPVWSQEPAFTEHSYRSVIADGPNGEALYVQNVGMDRAYLSLLERDGQWSDQGVMEWPRDGEEVLRLCYPNIVMVDRQVHFIGVADIVEPVAAWKAAKFERSGRQWDYVFRRLFYAWTPDIARQPFSAWVELENLDATAGYIRNGDIHLDAAGTAHMLWIANSVDPGLQPRFFPEVEMVRTLEYQTVQQGQLQPRRTLARWSATAAAPSPEWARFHTLADGTLVILASFSSGGTSHYRVAEVGGDWLDVPFAQPMAGTFLTNSRRAGSAPAEQIDMVGMSPRQANTLAYARVRIQRL